MNNLKIFCITNERIDFLEEFHYSLAKVGTQNLPENYLRCDAGNNIYQKEKFYSELTFQYWYWKNQFYQNNYEWIGFCQKRRFWINKNIELKNLNEKNIHNFLLINKQPEWENYNAIICEPIDVNNVKKIKIIKRGFKHVLKDPTILFNKKKRTIKLHFDMHHGDGNLKKAIDVMKENDRLEFYEYINSKTKFNPHIMFIARPEILDKWFEDLFHWLFNCEKIFGFKNLQGYDTTRLYAYLAERYLSFWFKKYTKYLEWPWTFFDNKNQK